MNTSQPSFLSKEAVFIRFAKLNNETVKWIGTSLLCIWAFLLQASFSHSHSDKCIRSNLRFSILPKDISTTIHEVWKSFRFNYAKLKWLTRDFHWLSNHTVSTWRIDFWGTLPLSIWDGTKNKIKNDKRTKSQQALDGHFGCLVITFSIRLKVLKRHPGCRGNHWRIWVLQHGGLYAIWTK